MELYKNVSRGDKSHWSPELDAGQINDGRHETSDEEEANMTQRSRGAEERFKSIASK